MATTPHDAGVTFGFGGSTFTITNITVSNSDVSGTTEEIDISHLGLTTGASVLTQKKPLKGSAGGDTGKEVSIDYIGTSIISGGATGTLSIGGVLSSGGGVATCMSSSVTATVNDVIKGTATFKVA